MGLRKASRTCKSLTFGTKVGVLNLCPETNSTQRMQLQGSIRIQTCKVIEIQALDLKGQDLPRMSLRLVRHRILQIAALRHST